MMIKMLEYISEAIGWLQIMASTCIIGGVIGWIVYNQIPGTTGSVIGMLIAASGFIFGIFRATHIRKKYGTVWFLSRYMASPDLDKKQEKNADTQTE